MSCNQQTWYPMLSASDGYSRKLIACNELATITMATYVVIAFDGYPRMYAACNVASKPKSTSSRKLSRKQLAQGQQLTQGTRARNSRKRSRKRSAQKVCSTIFSSRPCSESCLNSWPQATSNSFHHHPLQKKSVTILLQST